MSLAREAKKRKALEAKEEAKKLKEAIEKENELRAKAQMKLLEPPPMDLESEFDESSSESLPPPPPKKKRKNKKPKELVPVRFADPVATPIPEPRQLIAAPTPLTPEPSPWTTLANGLADAAPKILLAVGLYFIQFAIRSTPTVSNASSNTMDVESPPRDYRSNAPPPDEPIGDFLPCAH